MIFSNLNGRYFNYETANIQAMSWKDNLSLKSVTMLIRPQRAMYQN